MSYIGSTPTTQSFIAGTDYFNGDGSTVAFTLSRSVVSVNDIEVVINNVEQQPNTAYTVSGTTITFTSAPSAGSSNIYVRYLSTTTQSITPSQGTVNNASFGNVTAIPFVSGASLGAGNASIMKNRIINGQGMIDQRNAGASITANDNTFPVDRWNMSCTQSSKLTAQQNAGSVTPPVGFTNYIGFTSSSAYTVLTGDWFAVRQRIEGFNFADLQWGTANAKTVTISFQVYSSLTGTFSGYLTNGAQNRAYAFSYTISSANTWTSISVTVAGDTTGTWVGATNGTGVEVGFNLGIGSSYTGTAGSWQASGSLRGTTQTNIVSTNGATFYITGVQLEVGSSATGFEYVNYQTSLANCQRYYEKIGGENNYDFYMDAYNNAGTVITCPLYWKVNKRTNPSVGVVGTPGYGNCNSIAVAGSGAGTNNTTVQASVVSTGRAYCYFTSGTYFAISAEL